MVDAIILVPVQCPLTEIPRDWEEIVDILYDAANDLLYRPYPYLVVVEDEKPCFSGSSGKDDPVRIHTEVL